MKKILSKIFIAVGLVSFLGTMSSCSDDDDNGTPIVHVPAVNTIAPIPNESGVVRVHEGDIVTVTGINLDYVSAVYLDKTEASITEQGIKQIEFAIPVMNLPQQDDPHYAMLFILGQDNDTIYRRDYYITVPITYVIASSASAGEKGTVGSEATLTGRNLEQVNRITVNGVAVEKENFLSHGATEITFIVPAAEYEPGESTAEVNVYWGAANEVAKVEAGMKLFSPHVDQPAAQTQPAKMGDRIEITGQYLDMVKAVFIGEVQAPIMEQTENRIKIKVPADVAQENPSVVKVNITGTYGVGEIVQHAILFEDFELNTEFVDGALEPEVYMIVPEDGGQNNDRFYLRKKVTLSGDNLASVKKILVGDLEANITEQSKVRLEFVVPEDYTFTTATDLSLKAVYGDYNDQLELATVKVYPFFYWKGVRMGVNCNVAADQTEFASENAFFNFDTGEVLSAEEWLTSEFDYYAANNISPMSKANELNKTLVTKESYYGVAPYVFMTTASGTTIRINAPSNSDSQLKNVRYKDASGSYVGVSTTFGTPVFGFRVLTSASERVYGDAVVDGSIESLIYSGSNGGSGTPSYGTAEAGAVWIEGSVILAQYMTWTKGGRASAAGDVFKSGFIHITDVAAGSGGVATDFDKWIEFDCYWPNVPFNDDRE